MPSSMAERPLGVETSTWDHVAGLAFDSRPLELITFYHDGALVPPDRQLSLMKSLMEGE